MRTFIVAASACLMLMATPARTQTTTRLDHLQLQKRFQGKLAEAAIVRELGNRHDLQKEIVSLREHTLAMRRFGFANEPTMGYLLIGDLYSILSQFDLAKASYSSALHLNAKGSYLYCSSLSHLSRVHTTTGDWEEGLKNSQDALQSTRDLNCWAEGLQAQAEALFYSNSKDGLGRSLELASLAVDLFQELGDSDSQAQALLIAGYSAFQMELSDVGFAFARKALQIWSSLGSRHGEALAHTTLGFLEIRTAEPERSRYEYQQALQVFAEMGDKDNKAIVYSGLGLLENEIGNTEQAYEDFNLAQQLFAATHDLLGEAGVDILKATILRKRRNYREAKRLYQSELALVRRARQSRAEAAAYLHLASVFDAEGKYSQADAYCHKALELDQAIHNDYGEGESWRCLGRLYSKQQRDNDALAAFSRALPFKINAKATSEEAAVHHEIASVFDRRGQLESAQTEIEKAIHLIESERTRVAGFDDRASYFASVHQYYELYVDVLMKRHEQHPQQGFAQQAFEAWEEGKMRSLLDMLASSSQSAECSASNSCPEARALSLSEIQQEIHGDDSLVVEYALGKNAGYIWVVGDQNLWSYKIPNATGIRPLVERFQTALLARLNLSLNRAGYAQLVRHADRDYLQACQELTQILLAPLAHLLSNQRIIMVADGSLQHVPFSVLPFPSADGQETLLREHNELVYLPSASTLKFIRDRAKGRPLPPMQAAVYANPVFSRDDLRRGSTRTAGKKRAARPEYRWELGGALRDMNLDAGRLPRLPGTEEEAQALIDIMGEDHVFVATGVQATREAVLNGNLGNYRHILFATHSLLDEKHPELSGLVFSLVNEAGEKLDGFLRVKDIYQLKLSAEMVVLSACESALGRDMQSEGMIGLTRAFLYAGSRRVVSSLWKVDDEATAGLIRHFYQQIHDGKNPGEALRVAQRNLANDPQHPRWSHPYFWAGFILQGEYRPIDSQH
jgi:CHAT domain-containing protein